jgi:PilZ domain
MKEKRKDPRIDASIDVVVKAPQQDKLTLKTTNLSRSGLFLLASGYDLPEQGATINLSMGEFIQSDQSLILQARVARKTTEGVGLEYIKS